MIDCRQLISHYSGTGTAPSSPIELPRVQAEHLPMKCIATLVLQELMVKDYGVVIYGSI
jgi:hypothetical protein